MPLKDIVGMDKKYYMNTFGDRTPVCFEYGKGINLWDTEGKKYYDFFSGIAVSSLGHAHPNLVNAIKAQAEKLIHCSSLYYVESQALLAKKLVENSCAERVFFSNSGAEANDGAIKLVRMHFRKKGEPQKHEIISLKQSFHGRSITTMSATGQEKYREQCKPLTPGFKFAPRDDFDALLAEVSLNTAAIIVEVIQGEGGVNPLGKEYMKNMRKLCDEKNIFLIIDEVQCGIGRTGKMFGFEHFDIEPDIFTLAKGLGGGVPIGAILAKGSAAKTFTPGDHGSTFGGNPLACSAALAVVNTILEDGLVENSAVMGEYFNHKLNELSKKHNIISEVRGKGLMIGVQLEEDKATEIKNECFKEGFLIGTAGENILRILPPLIISEGDIDLFIGMLDKVLAVT